AALVFGADAARGGVSSQMQSLVGGEGAKAIEQMIASANQPTTGVVATSLSMITLLFGASGVFGQLQESLNAIWGVQPKSGRGVWGIVRDRFLSFAMVMGIAFLLLVSLLLSAALAALGTVFNWLPESLHFLSEAIHFGVSFAIVTVLFAMIYKILPDAKIAWR